MKTSKMHGVLLKGQSGTSREGESQAKAVHEPIIDFAHLELFTEGDLDQEKMLTDIFLVVGEIALEAMKAHISGESSSDAWNAAAHKLRGSSAQIGANGLSVLCLEAERGSRFSQKEKEALFIDIEASFMQIKSFFESRQI